MATDQDAVVLTSYPRSGNTQLRGYIERITGLVTGSDCDITKKLNVAMRMLLELDFDSPVKDMMDTLDWLNVPNMWRWCCVRTFKRILKTPSQTPHLWSLVDVNADPRYNTRYNALKTKWRKHTRWARESFLFSVVDTYNALGLHGKYFEDYEHMRDSVKQQLKTDFGNENIK